MPALPAAVRVVVVGRGRRRRDPVCNHAGFGAPAAVGNIDAVRAAALAARHGVPVHVRAIDARHLDGAGAACAAGAVVARDVAPRAPVMGNPAQCVRRTGRAGTRPHSNAGTGDPRCSCAGRRHCRMAGDRRDEFTGMAVRVSGGGAT